MIVLLWNRYRTGPAWWLLVLGAFLLADALIGTWLLSWEIRMLKEQW